MSRSAVPRGVAALLAATASVATANAQGPGASFGVRDPAATACALFSEMAERAPSGTERQFYDWAQGYFAGRTTGSAGQRLASEGRERSRNFDYLLEYCAKNPEAKFEAAVRSLWDHLIQP